MITKDHFWQTFGICFLFLKTDTVFELKMCRMNYVIFAKIIKHYSNDLGITFLILKESYLFDVMNYCWRFTGLFLSFIADAWSFCCWKQFCVNYILKFGWNLLQLVYVLHVHRAWFGILSLTFRCCY